MVKVWDLWVRLFHWCFAIVVVGLLISGRTGFQFFDWHKTAGEIALALLAFRIVWGIWGSSTAKLLPLFKPPALAFGHLAKLVRRRETNDGYGHNAAGGYAVLALLAVVAIQAISGSFIADEDEFVEGRFYDSVSSDFSSLMYDIHYYNSQVLIALVVLHIVMIFVYLLIARSNLVKPMFTGKVRENDAIKTAQLSDENINAEPVIQSVWVGLVIALVTATVFYFVFWI